MRGIDVAPSSVGQGKRVRCRLHGVEQPTGGGWSDPGEKLCHPESRQPTGWVPVYAVSWIPEVWVMAEGVLAVGVLAE